MKTTGCYYMILSVYISLWSCQLLTCHLTHSLIVLTDSYINFYKILDISLGILHLNTQFKVRNRLNDGGDKLKDSTGSVKKPMLRLFDTVCTYNFKRLPVLGSFINGLFLAALLMSAAIEGIQTCFHANHTDPDNQKSILLEHPVTYPGILVGFALVGAMMQWCSLKAHEMREQELGSESLLDVRAEPKSTPSISELDVNQLSLVRPKEEGDVFFAPSTQHEPPQTPCLSLSLKPKSDNRKFVLNGSRPESFESVPLDGDVESNNDHRLSKISLRSLKLVSDDSFEVEQYQQQQRAIKILNAMPKDLESAKSPNRAKASLSDRWWLIVRYCASPVALIACASIIYFIHEEMVTEIADATFAILVVILLFTASYPPMKKAGKVLLQTAPDGLDVDKLKRSLKSVSPLVVDIQALHVWSLTARSNRIATCHLHLNKDKIHSEEQVNHLLCEIRFKFLSQNIKCATIQPIFVEPANG